MPARHKFRKKNADNVRILHPESSYMCVQHISPKGEALGTIPTGKQLARTPVKRTSLVEKNNEIDTRYILTSNAKREINDENAFPAEISGNAEEDVFNERVSEHRETDEEFQTTSIRRPSTISVPAKQPEEMNPNHFIEGMVGYQWTQEDLEFVENVKIKRQMLQLKNERSVLMKELEKEKRKRDLELASREKLLADHPEAAAFCLTMSLAQEFLSQKLGATEVEALDPESVLAKIQGADIQQAVHEARADVAELEKRMAAQRLREKLDSATLKEQAEIDSLSSELSELKSELLREEDALRAAQKQMEVLKVPESPMDVGEADNIRVLQCAAQKQVEVLKVPGSPMDQGEVDNYGALRRSKRIAKRKQNFLEREEILRKIRSNK